MPNARRRRFSVKNDIAGRETNKTQNGIQCSRPESDQKMKVMTNNVVSMKFPNSKNKTNGHTSKNTTNKEIKFTDSEKATSTLTIENNSAATQDRDVTSSKNVDLCNIQISVHDKGSTTHSKENINMQVEVPNITKDTVLANRDRNSWRRDKHPREHRVKVRSPKRRVALCEIKNKFTQTNTRTTRTLVIDCDLEGCDDIEPNVVVNVETIETTENSNRPSEHSMDDMCRICHGGNGLTSELGLLISACSCRGTVGRVHVKCLERWLTESGKSRCELCGTRYLTRRVHKYGVPRALVMWILSQNAKQLMVDSLGIMLMSPLAVLAAWLSGRTLAGLMTQDHHVTPWPLASTFVLACMTLVCYYCWIVSAATRHAIGWWIWYRSQYEVRLQFQENET